MKSAIASIAFAVLAGLASAKVAFTNSNYNVEAGKPFTLEWDGGKGPYTINLKDGPSDDLKTVQALATGTTDDSLTVTLSSSLVSGNYAFEIVDSSDDTTNYSSQFPIVGTGSSSTAASSSKASSTAATSTKASSTLTTTTTSGSSSASASSTEDSSSSSTKASSTTSSNASKTTSASASSSTAPNTNGAQSFAAPLVLAAAGLALAF
ncbi:hypothetical protein JX265_008662 [Neoarthrinium moseri]|uniref:Yeast cell wall synthesis Kre9/Knh1-like N-terminal domain-containing protein n=1 Tax=Neoarthrinium moseri TaxID=1658444 RepID=A0A9P9WHP6_9PEZI|nr:uncharacterized protein JN550_013529 [Neoarthrinium moseri]KAI1849251.1 hypothetical protein JX266_005212 [Neoarthrinium moseri]KAI1856963.1 hypothetical protein JN550_013529 [Neoarthrinium moseri]KAI1864291.1 hypothetical protein JX265_008662 [Neoarthrinium moseri]